MRTFNKRTIYSIGLSALGLICLLFASYYNIKRLHNRERWVTHTHEVLTHTGRVLLYTTRCAVLARNFMLTGNKTLPGQFSKTRSGALNELVIINALTTDNPVIKPTLDSAAFYINKCLEFSGQVIESSREKGIGPTILLVQKAEGVLYVNKAEGYIQKIEHDETNLLAAREASSKKAMFFMNVILAVTVGFILVMITLLVVNSWQDALERNRLIDELVTTGEQMKTAESLALFGFWNVNILTGAISSSDEMYRIWGYEPGDKKSNFDDYMIKVHPDDREFVREKMLGLSDQTGMDTYTFRLLDNDTIKYIATGITAIRNKEDKLLSITGYVQDITERMKVAEALEQSEANLRTIFDHTEISYVLINDALKIVSFNNLAQKYSEEQNQKKLIRGESVINYFSPSRYKEVNQILIKLKGGESVRYEYCLPQKDGAVKWFEANWVNVTGADKKSHGFILANTDITDKKNAGLEREKFIAELIQRNTALEQFSYIVSHNLRLPVANIIGLAEMFKTPHPDLDEQHDIVEKLAVSVNNLDHIVKDLNMILKVRGKVDEEKVKVNLNDIAKEVINRLNGMIVEAGIRIECDFSEAEHLYSIHSYLYSIFYNLFVNSINYRRKDVETVISIKSVMVNNHVELLFSDNGKGIDLDKNGATLFDLYRRFDTSVEGKGMGLFMVKTQVETIDGTIEVKSKPNEGTEFSILIPTTEV